MPARPWPRPGSRKRLTFWMSAASSAAPSPQRSPNRLAWVLSSERRKPIPASLTAMTDHPTAEPAPKGIRLHRNPATGAGVLHNILACLRKRHTESQRRLALEAQLARAEFASAPSEILSTTSCMSSDGADRRHVEQHVGGPGGRHLGHLAVELEQLGGVAEEADPGPVALHVLAGRHRKERPLPPASASAWPAVSMPIRP